MEHAIELARDRRCDDEDCEWNEPSRLQRHRHGEETGGDVENEGHGRNRRAGRVLRLRFGAGGGSASRGEPVMHERGTPHHDDHEELPHGSERRSRGGEERPPLVDVAPDRLARDDERMSHVGDAERIRERRGRERRDGRGGGERAGVPPARNAMTLGLEVGLFSVKKGNLLSPVLDYVTKVSSTETDITDPAGRKTTYLFSSVGLLTSVGNPDGHAVTYSYGSSCTGATAAQLCRLPGPSFVTALHLRMTCWAHCWMPARRERRCW